MSLYLRSAHSGNFTPEIIKNGLVFHIDAQNPLSYSGLSDNRFAIRLISNFTTGPALSPNPEITEGEIVLILEKNNIGNVVSGYYRRPEYTGGSSRIDLDGSISGFLTNTLVFNIDGSNTFVFTISSQNSLNSWDIEGFQRFFSGSSATTFTFGTRGGDVFFESLYSTGEEYVRDISRSANIGTITPQPATTPLNEKSSIFIKEFPSFFYPRKIDMAYPSSINTNRITASVWCSVKSFVSGDQGFFSDWNNSSNLRSWMIAQIGGTPSRFRFWLSSNGTSTINIQSTSTLSVDTVYNIVGVYDGSTMFLYINNILEASTSYTSGIFSGGDLFQIGLYGDTRFSNAIYYSLALYDRALSPVELDYNFNLMKDRYGV